MSKVKVVEKKGLINEEGKVIVPIEYQNVEVLKSGVYVAQVSKVKEQKLVNAQYYHHKKLVQPKDESFYHLYTDKGRVIFIEPILEYIYDVENNERIVAVAVPSGWQIVELDYENNVLKPYFSAVDEVIAVCDGYIAVRENDGRCAVYSLKTWEKILDLNDVRSVSIKRGKGFLVRENGGNARYQSKNGKVGFYTLNGCLLLDFEWDHIECAKDFIEATEYHAETQKVKRRRAFLYDGEEL